MAQTTDDVDATPRPGVPTEPEDVAHRPSRFVTILTWLGAWAPAVGAAALLAYAVRAGMPASHVVRATLVVLGTQILPGAVAWRAVRPRRGWLLEDVAMGFAIGSVFAIGAQVVAGLTGQSWIAFGPLLVPVALLLIPVTRARVRSARTEPVPWWWGPTVTTLFFVAVPQLRYYFRQVPLTWSGVRSPHVDAYLHLALAGQLAHRGPTTFPWVASEPLAYHWFSHAWVAQVSVASGVGLDEVLFRFMPVVLPVVVVLSVATAAVRLTNRLWAGPVAALLAMAGGDLNAFDRFSIGFPITPLSPSLGLGAPTLVAIVTVMALRWNRTMLAGGVALLPVLAIGAAGAKGSTVPLIVAGLGLAIVAMLVFDRSQVWRLVGDLAIVAACLVFAVVFVFRGSDAGLHFSPAEAAKQGSAASWLGFPETAYQQVLILSIFVIGLLARGVGLFALPFSRTGRRSPLTWLLMGCALAGAGAVVVFTHPGASQWYFARTAIPLLAIGSALGLVALFGAIRPGKRVWVIALGLLSGPAVGWLPAALLGPLQVGTWTRAWQMMGVAGLVVVLVGVLAWLLGGSARQRLRLAAAAMVLTVLSAGVATVSATLFVPTPGVRRVGINSSFATSRGQVDAARWIRDHSDVDDLVMTNRHCITPVEPYNCDSRRWVVAAFTERQVLLEGWTATPMSAKLGPNGRDSITVSYWHPELQSLNDGFIARPTERAAAELRDLGVRWIFVDHTRPYADTLEPFATLRFQTADVDVYELIG